MQMATNTAEQVTDWIEIGKLEDIPKRGARIVETAAGNIAVFRTTKDEVFALRDKCPHKGGPLSQGIVHDKRVTCPLHDRKIHLDSGQAVAPDRGHVATFPVHVDGETVFLSLRPNAGCPNPA